MSDVHEATLPPLTLVTVVFEAEIALLRLQARSMRLFVPRDDFAAVVVIDNTRHGLGAGARSGLLREYGHWAPAVRFLRAGDISPLPASRGWVSQQVLKLLVHRQVETPFFLVLDAKNHWVRPTGRGTFLNPDGRARGASHEYRQHPLRPTLVHVLEYLGVPPDRWIESFPATHTPVVMSTELVGRMTEDIERRSGRPFAEEFVRSDLTEFFLYAGWIIATSGGLDAHVDGTVIRSANVWPGRRSAADFARTLDDAERTEAPFLSVHRTALAKVGTAGAARLADFWVARGLFTTRREARVFIADFKARYLWSMSIRKARTVLGSAGQRAAPSLERLRSRRAPTL